MIAALLAGCVADPEPRRPAEPEPEPHSSVAPPDSTAPVPAHSGEPLPEIAEATASRCPDPTPRPASPGDLHRVLLDTPARCNDGSAPALYVAPATDPAHANDWVLSLQSGSFCTDDETCAARWCGDSPPYDAALMSTRWAAPTTLAVGVLDPRQDNVFATWNRVEFVYCSSDLWVGTHGDQPIDAEPPYRVHFEGHDIFEAGLDALELGVQSDDGAVSLGPLSAPGVVVLAGSSASGFGVLQKMDRTEQRVSAERFLAIVDGWTTHPAAEVVTAEASERVRTWTDALYAEAHVAMWGSVLDESCVAGSADPARCTDSDGLLRNHLTAPRVVRADLTDPVMYPFWFEGGFTPLEYPGLVAATLRAQAGGSSVSTIGSNCGVHIVSRSTAFFNLGVADALTGGRSWTLHDAVVAALLGAGPTAIDNPLGAFSECP